MTTFMCRRHLSSSSSWWRGWFRLVAAVLVVSSLCSRQSRWSVPFVIIIVVEGFVPPLPPLSHSSTLIRRLGLTPEKCSSSANHAFRVEEPVSIPGNSNDAAVCLRVVHFNDVYKLDHLPKLQVLLDQLKQQSSSPSSPSSSQASTSNTTSIPTTTTTTRVICTLGGDFFSPSLLSSMDAGASMTACLSHLPVDFCCLGNHEADVGTRAFCDNVATLQLQGGTTVINTNWPVMPSSSTNNHNNIMKDQVIVSVTSASSSQHHVRNVALWGLLETDPRLYLPGAFTRGAQPAAIPIMDCVEQRLTKLGFIHHNNDNTTTTSTPQKTASTTVANSNSNNNIDLVLPLTHQGIAEDLRMAQTFGSSTYMPVILGGHDHDVYDETTTTTTTSCNATTTNSGGTCRVLKAGQDAEHAFVVDFIWHNATTQQPDIQVQLIDIAGGPAVPLPLQDQREGGGVVDGPVLLQDMVNSYHAQLDRIDRTVLKKISSRQLALSSVGIRHRPTTMGSLICTALRKALQTDVAILNAGAIRGNQVYTLAAPPAADGDGFENINSTDSRSSSSIINKTDMFSVQYRPFFTFKDLVQELPYETEICVVELPGRVLEEAIDYSRAAARRDDDTNNNDKSENDGGSGAFLQTCNACLMNDDDNKGNTWKIVSIGGEPFDPDRVYRVACLYYTLQGLDDIKPLVDWAKHNKGAVPKIDSVRPAKELVLQVYHREIWRSLGKTFDEIDTGSTEYITPEELRAALADAFSIDIEDPSDELVEDTLKAFDANTDGVIMRDEYDACMAAIDANRFDLDANAMVLFEVEQLKNALKDKEVDMISE